MIAKKVEKVFVMDVEQLGQQLVETGAIVFFETNINGSNVVLFDIHMEVYIGVNENSYHLYSLEEGDTLEKEYLEKVKKLCITWLEKNFKNETTTANHNNA